MEDRNRAAQMLEELKSVLLKEEDAQTKLGSLPETWEEMIRRREEVRERNSEPAKAAHARTKAKRA